MIPMIDLTLDRQLLAKIKREIEGVIDSKSYILGAKLASFEKKFEAFVDTKYAVGVGSGTDALKLALRACGISYGDKVLTVSLTSPFTALAIVEEGAIPVFCDIDRDSLTIDVEDAQKRIDENVRAIIPVHLFGNPCQMEAILELAQKFKLKVIEDACQAHGAQYKGRMVGSFGDAAAFSFYPTKNLGAMGDAGMVVTNNRRVADMVRLLRHGGQSRRFWHKVAGINSRLDEIQASILSIKLRSLRKDNKRRRKLAKRYRRLLSDLPIKFQESFEGGESCWHIFAIRTKERNKLRNYLAKRGIISDIYYPNPVNEQSAFKKFSQDTLPVTKTVTREILALPIYPNLSIKNQDLVIKTIRAFFKENR